MKKSNIISLVSACSFLVATAVSAAPPDKAQKSPAFHFTSNVSVNTYSADRLATRVAGPFSPTTTMELSGITTTNIGVDPVVIHYRAVMPDPGTPPTNSSGYCTEGFGEDRIFHVIDELARVAVPGGETVNIAIPGETVVPGQYVNGYGGPIEPSEDWCLLAFYLSESLYPLPTAYSIVDVVVWGKIETP